MLEVEPTGGLKATVSNSNKVAASAASEAFAR